MIIKKHTYSLFLGLSLFCLVSCIITPDVKSWIETTNIEEVKGKYHFLSDDGLKIYLPTVFKKYSTAEYEYLLDSLITTKEDYKLELKRLQHLREMQGNFYIFFDEETRATYTLNTLPYMPLHKSDAQYILGIISMNNEKISQKTNLEFTKLTAKYSASKGAQIFKAIHKVDNLKKQHTYYNASYIVSANGKTIYVQLLTGFEANFDPFLQKTIF